MNNTGEIITQKKLRTTLRFGFEQDQFSFTHSDDSGEVQRNIAYETLDLKNPATVTVKTRFISRKIFLLSIVAVFVIPTAMHHSTNTMILDALAQTFPCLFAVMLLLYLIPAKITYTMIAIPQGKIRVMHDKNYDAIMGKLKEFWLQRMRKLYAVINLSNDPNREMQKFVWLKENGIIDESEFNAFCSKLRDAIPPSFMEIPGSPKLN